MPQEERKMEQFAEGESTREEIKNKLRQNFDGKIVRKDLTKKIKEGANVPVYVLEFLLGQYCSSDDETVIEKGVQNVKRILADNFVRPDESQKILSQLRKKGSYTIIDMVTVQLDMKKGLLLIADNIDNIYDEINALIREKKTNVKKVVNDAIISLNWGIGKRLSVELS